MRILRALCLILSTLVMWPLAPAQDWQGLHDAAASGDAARIRAILDANPGFIDAGEEGVMNALTRACLGGHEACALLLIERGAALDKPSRGGWFPLNAAVHSGKRRIVEALLASGRLGPSLDMAGIHGWTALSMAAAKADLPLAKLLRSSGAAFRSEDGPRDLLCAAASSGDKATFRWALSLYEASEISRIDSEGRSPLHWLAEGNVFISRIPRGETQILWIAAQLLKWKVDKTLRDKEGKTARDIALSTARPKLAQLLR